MLTADGEIINEPLAHPTWKTPFNHDTEAEAKRTALYCLDPTLAQQHGKEEADINTIVDRFLTTGLVPQIPVPPTYEQFDEVFDFQTAMNLIAAGKASFMAMPAEIRNAFHNSPELFVNTIDDWLSEKDTNQRNKNLEVMRAMNLAVPAGPPADTTTLGEVLAAIKEQGTPKPAPAGTPLKGAP